MVIDIAEGVRELFDLLYICDEVYMLTKNDYNAHMRVEMFINELQRDDKFDMKKLRRISRTGGDCFGT